MRIDRFTSKMQEGLQEGQALASQLHHQELTPEHLLLALLRQQDGLARPLLEKLNVRTSEVESQLEQELARRPKISGAAEQYINADLNNVLNQAETEMTRHWENISFEIAFCCTPTSLVYRKWSKALMLDVYRMGVHGLWHIG